MQNIRNIRIHYQDSCRIFYSLLIAFVSALVFTLTPFFLWIKFLLFGAMDLVLQQFDWLPFGSGEKSSGHTMDLVCQVYV